MMLDLFWKVGRGPLFMMDAEKAHRLTMGTMRSFGGLCGFGLGMMSTPPPPSLRTEIAGLTLASPIGLAAGLDKDGEAISIWPKLGFGFIEMGTVTAHPQKGNEQPRLFRLKSEQGLINRMGFNNHGSQALAEVMKQLRESDRWPNIPVGANIGKSKITPLEEAPEDYCMSIRRLRDFADYFTVNVSSPNTPGLRDLQSADKLQILLEKVKKESKDLPVFVKFAPDMHETDLVAAIECVIEQGCDGIIATNTTNTRPGTTDRLQQTGGLSGNPLWPLAKSQVMKILDVCAQRIPVIGVGGVDSTEKARKLLNMGCKAVQLYTGLIFRGPGLISQINKQLPHQIDK